jgi:hypothetical protein
VLGDSRGQQYAIDLLQQVTQVRVLSSPQLLVMDNEPARLQVGSLVPFLTQSAQSTLAAGAPVVSSVDYRETGVITEVIPRVSSGGVVTLDISQQVSDVDPNAPSFGINSPTFLERAVRSRIVVQDGQTIGLAGLIRDNSSRGNQGVPFLKDVPVLGALLGTPEQHQGADGAAGPDHAAGRARPARRAGADRGPARGPGQRRGPAGGPAAAAHQRLGGPRTSASANACARAWSGEGGAPTGRG